MGNSESMKSCALCGQVVDTSRFCITETWTGEEVASKTLAQAALDRAEVDGEGSYTFYFCRWRHIGDFLSSCGMASEARGQKTSPS